MTIEELLEATLNGRLIGSKSDLIGFSLSGQPDTTFAMIYVSNIEIRGYAP
jgi:hypothetical protein